MTYIGKHAFNGNHISNVVLPSSVKHIGDYAFYKNGLKKVETIRGLVSIGSYAFNGNNLSTIEIPATVISVGDYAFYANDNLATATIYGNTNRFDNVSEFLPNKTKVDYVYEDSDVLNKIELVIGKQTYKLNDELKTIDAPPVIVNGTTMVPVRFVAEALGATVGWEDSTQTVSLNDNGKTTHLTIGVVSDGMTVAPYISNSRTMVPLRYVSETLGSSVEWDGNTRTITIYK